MNAPAAFASLAVREADLRDAGECARIASFVAEHCEGTPFHLPAWSIAVAEGCGQRAHYLLAERADGALVGVLPLTFVRSTLFGRALVSTGFGVGGGVLAHDPATVRALADAAWALAERLGCPGVELRGGPLPGPGWTSDDQTYLGFARDLAADDEAELLAIPRKQRAEVRKALANDLTVTTGRGDADDHYRVYATSVRNLGTPVFPRALFAAVLERCEADVLTVRHERVAVASVLSLVFKETVYPYWGGGTDAARGLRANDMMYFALMRHARERGCTRFDFGRSKAGTGAAAFKKNWGFAGVPLVYHHRTANGQAPRTVNPLDPKYAAKVAAWKRLPLPIANLVGPLIARGLG
jgi:FemAB-related protein (PEP-CTERM system-associated)